MVEDGFREAVLPLFEAGSIDLYDTDCLREISQYRFFDPRLASYGVANRRARYGPPSSGTDDLLDAHMMALQGREWATAGYRAAVQHYGGAVGSVNAPGGPRLPEPGR